MEMISTLHLNLKKIIFADHTILFQQMNKELKSVFTWFKANELSINIDKTKWTIFHPTSKKPAKFPDLFTDDITLEQEAVSKFWAYLLIKISHKKPISS